MLLVRLSAIGDLIHTMPVACALKERFPETFLVWAAGEPGADLLQGHEAVDELISLPRAFLKSPRAVWQLRRRLRALRFDVTIDAQGLTKSAIVARLAGTRRRIGFGNPWGRELSKWLNNELVDTTSPHAIDRQLELLRPLGIDSPPVHFKVPEHQPDAEAAEQLIRRAGVEGGFALLNAGAGWPSKLWPAERFAAVAAHLGREWGLPTLVISGNGEERVCAEQIASGSGEHAQLAPTMGLRQLAALSRRARLFVSSDTGPLHLAVAVGTPCVGLYGPWSAEKHGPYGPKHVALQEATFEGSTRERRNAPPEIMEAISVKLVCEACDEILQREDLHAA